MLPLLLVQLWFWGRYFRPFTRRPAEAEASEPGPDTEPVSIILCAHNELENLRELVPLLLRQDYPAGFELVLIDDRSQDDTYLYAQQLSQYYPGRFRLVTVGHTPAGFAPKKYALTLGIKAARHERLLFTDADCRPVSPAWLRLMQRGFSTPHPYRGGAGGRLAPLSCWASPATPSCRACSTNSFATKRCSPARSTSASPGGAGPTWAWAATWPIPAPPSTVPRGLPATSGA
ncbi:glycosyltransferase [Hymenobacter sp. BRD128]|uniref:glycosyltransferase n=1 Tax=Hymenobacter sp. BRD128 TaxID=2675878 RepID=UPI0015642AA5|nr:glycosyltransferase [Hymenobacter sp. BRD128]QKG57392.1 glycosyltransferase [Hymenobacter sp. BRD128]